MAGPKPALYTSAVTVVGFICLALSATAVGLPIWGHFEYLAGGWDSEKGYFGPFRTCKKLNYGREVCGDFHFRPHGNFCLLFFMKKCFKILPFLYHCVQWEFISVAF